MIKFGQTHPPLQLHQQDIEMAQKHFNFGRFYLVRRCFWNSRECPKCRKTIQNGLPQVTTMPNMPESAPQNSSQQCPKMPRDILTMVQHCSHKSQRCSDMVHQKCNHGPKPLWKLRNNAQECPKIVHSNFEQSQTYPCKYTEQQCLTMPRNSSRQCSKMPNKTAIM